MEDGKTTSRVRGEHLICRQAAMSGLARKKGGIECDHRAQPCLKSCCASIFVSQKLLRFRQRRLCIIERMKEKGYHHYDVFQGASGTAEEDEW